MEDEDRPMRIAFGIVLLAGLLAFLAAPAAEGTTNAEDVCPGLGSLPQELKAGEPAALERFWARVAREGTPLVEPAGGDASEVLVTFLWRGGEETRNVLVVDSIADLDSEDGIAEVRLSRLPGTDVWCKSRRMRADARFAYFSFVRLNPGPCFRA